MPQVRLSITQMMEAMQQHRKLVHKVFRHKKSGEHYQLLFQAFDEASNELMAVYCMTAMTQLKFVRPMSEFVEKFEESHG